MDQKYIIALEFSGSQIKGAFAKTESSPYAQSIPTVEAIVHEDNTSCVQYGRVENLIDAARDAKFVLQKLENDPKMKDAHIVGAYVGVAGRSLGAMRTSAELTLPTDDSMITEEMVERLMRETTKTVPGDKKVLKVLPRKFLVDNRVQSNPVGSIGKKIKGEFTVVTCNPSNTRNLDLVLNERLQLPVAQYVITPLAIADMVLGEGEKQLGCVLVDMGAQTTTILIYKDKVLQQLVTLPLGSRNITLDVATGLNLTFDRAEVAKKTQGNAVPEPTATASDESNRINCYVQARAGEIIANIVAQIGFAGYKASDLSAGFIITGRGTKLKNFAQALESQSKMKVRLASIPAVISVADTSVDPVDFTSLIAIARYGLNANDNAVCVEFEQLEVPEVHEATEKFDPFSASEHDDYLYEDSDKEKVSRMQALEKQRRQEAQRRAKEQKERDDEIQKRNREEEKRKKKEEAEVEKSTGGSSKLLEKLRDKITTFFTTEDDDVNLDDN